MQELLELLELLVRRTWQHLKCVHHFSVGCAGETAAGWEHQHTKSVWNVCKHWSPSCWLPCLFLSSIVLTIVHLWFIQEATETGLHKTFIKAPNSCQTTHYFKCRFLLNIESMWLCIHFGWCFSCTRPQLVFNVLINAQVKIYSSRLIFFSYVCIHLIVFFSQAKERELELKNSWADNKLSRRQTQAKYGF